MMPFGPCPTPHDRPLKKMRTGSAALSLPSLRAFFAFLITERLSTTISEPGTGYEDKYKEISSASIADRNYMVGRHDFYFMPKGYFPRISIHLDTLPVFLDSFTVLTLSRMIINFNVFFNVLAQQLQQVCYLIMFKIP